MKVQCDHPQIGYQYTWGRNMQHSIYNLGPTVSFKLNPISSYDRRETKRHNSTHCTLQFHISLRHTSIAVMIKRSVRFSQIQCERACCVCSFVFVCLSACTLEGKKLEQSTSNRQ